MAIVEDAEAGLKAAVRGATIIQLRGPRMAAAALEREAMRLAAESPVMVVISSRVDIALAANLAGVNLPENDISVRDARLLLGDRFVSRSVHSAAGARDAEADGADMLIFGPVWESASHPDAVPAGLEALARVAAAVRIPVLAIGGVSNERIPELLSICAGYAAISLFQ
jgi:thiamine-phosphate diphosphorylase